MVLQDHPIHTKFLRCILWILYSYWKLKITQRITDVDLLWMSKTHILDNENTNYVSLNSSEFLKSPPPKVMKTTNTPPKNPYF